MDLVLQLVSVSDADMPWLYFLSYCVFVLHLLLLEKLFKSIDWTKIIWDESIIKNSIQTYSVKTKIAFLGFVLCHLK